MKKFLLLFFAATAIGMAALPAQAQAASPVSVPLTQLAASGCPARLLTLPAWYRGLKDDTKCDPKLSKISDIWIIALNIVEMMMQVVIYVASAFTIWGGFRYMIARGEPDKISSAKSTITHAVTGVIISVVAVAAINFIVDAAL